MQKSPLISAADEGTWPLIPFPQVPPSCEQQMEPLRAEIQALNEVIDDQQRYILELHKNHGRQLQRIPSSHLGAGNVHRGGRQTASPRDTRVHNPQSWSVPSVLNPSWPMSRLLWCVCWWQRGQRGVRDPPRWVSHCPERLLWHEQRRRMDGIPEEERWHGKLWQVCLLLWGI